MSFCIFLIDGVQSLHQQIFVVHHVVAAVSGDHRCVWPVATIEGSAPPSVSRIRSMTPSSMAAVP